MSDYDFIFDNQQKKKGIGLLQGSRQRMVMMFGFVAVMLIIVIVAGSTLLNSGKPSASGYIPITVYQEELLRILENRDALSDSSLKSKYATLNLAITSDYQQSSSYLLRNGVKITPEQRGPYYYFDLESDLETAATANRFDSELESYVDTAVADYSNALVNLTPTPGQEDILEQAKQNIINYNGLPEGAEE